MRAARRLAAALLVALAVLLMPDSAPAPTAVSLVRLETAKAVDFGDGVVWVLALGSDSRTSDPREGNADAIELIAVDFETGSAVALGIPRDTWVDVDGYKFAKINSALLVGGETLAATEVEQLTGIAPQYVVMTGFAGFEELVDTVGGVVVDSDVAFEDPEYDLDVVPGPNPMDGQQATGFARSRDLPGDDFARMGNQQRLLAAILAQLRQHENDEGFVESSAVAALQHLDTNLSPGELYRFSQAITQVQPSQAATCVITGAFDTIDGNSAVILDSEKVRRVAADAADDAVLQQGCP